MQDGVGLSSFKGGGRAGLEGQALEEAGRKGVDWAPGVNSPELGRVRGEVKSSYFEHTSRRCSTSPWLSPLPGSARVVSPQRGL